MPSASFAVRQFITEPPVPTTSYAGRTVVLTGGSGGLGLEACKHIVKLGASKVIIAVRNVGKGEAAAKTIQASTSCADTVLEVWPLDLSSYASVLKFCDRATSELPRLDALISNAGIWATAFRQAEDNEETITTNVISQALLGFLLYPKLQETASRHGTFTHFTITASELYEVAKFKERKAPDGKIFEALNDTSKADLNDRYQTSKLLNIFTVRQMAAMYPVGSKHGVIANCIGPGYCQSELHRDVDMGCVEQKLRDVVARPTEVGSRTIVYGASAPSDTHGKYVPDCKVREFKALAQGKAGIELQERVWVELKQKLEKIRPGVTSPRMDF